MAQMKNDSLKNKNRKGIGIGLMKKKKKINPKIVAVE